MAAPLLFVIHGMGVYPPGWEQEVIDALEQARQRYPYFAGLSLNELFRVVPLRYDQVFDSLRQLWRDDAEQLLQSLQAPGGDAFRRALTAAEADQLLAAQAGLGKDSFFTTHLLDVLLYRCSALGEQVRVVVAKALVEALLAETGSVPSWSMLAHSLGTAVTHDTLHALYAEQTWREGKVNRLFVPERYQADNVIMLANVSRVLASRISPYASRVRPGTGGVCRHFINAAHVLDPIPRVMAFAPDNSWLAGQDRRSLFEPITLEAVTGPNVHGYSHYLRDPRVHVPLFRALCGEDCISEQEFATAYQLFYAESANAAYDALRAELKALKAGETGDFAELLAVWRQFAQIVDRYRDAMAGG